jgi:hypothetical protein
MSQEQDLLKKTSDFLEDVSGGNGSYFLELTTVHADKMFKSIVIQEDTIISLLSGVASDGTTVKDYYVTQNINNSILLKAGAVIKPDLHGWFTAITITSGSAIGYEKTPA